MDIILIIGFIAAALTTISFAPQAIKIWKTHSAKDISLGTYIILFAGVSLWLVYGIFISSMPIILANSFTIIFVLIILFFKIKLD